MGNPGAMLEVATNEDDMWAKLRGQNNAELDKALELQRRAADEYDRHAYDSDTDVKKVDETTNCWEGNRTSTMRPTVPLPRDGNGRKRKRRGGSCRHSDARRSESSTPAEPWS